MRRLTLIVPIASLAVLVAVVTPPGAAAPTGVATSALVTVASPQDLHPRNAQNEPALAVDASRPDVLAAGANELIDMQPCSEEASTTAGACSFPLGTFNLGVGLTGIYFSFDRGQNWIQPTYQGLTAANCDPTVEPCEPEVGDIHTIPNYYEAGLRTRSDPAVAFGPAPGTNGQFSWSNGSRLYAATLATNLTDTVIGQGSGGQNSTFAVTVSYIDNVTEARIQDQGNWSQPYFAAPHVSSTGGVDKEQVWADNAASSPFFGNVYVCYTDFHSFSGGNNFPLKPFVSTSRDGGVKWTSRQVAPPWTSRGAHQGCTVRTDSEGVVYAFFTHFQVGQPGLGTHTMIRSFDGGKTWEQPPREIVAMNDMCYQFDPVQGRCVSDGIAGFRNDLAAMPSVDIANGAPTGADATDEIVDVWADGRLGEGSEAAFISYSTDRGDTWSEPAPISPEGERVIYAAPAIAPNGTAVYVSYMSITGEYQTTTDDPRPEHGAFLGAPVIGGVPGSWVTLYSGPYGDVRGSSQGRRLYNEFMGDYTYAIATRTYGAGVWTEVRRTDDCPAMDDWREASYNAGALQFPAPWPLSDCPDNFGNNDIFSATTG